MIYITYDPVTGEVDEIAYSEERMVPEGREHIAVPVEEWKAAQGKVMKVVDGKFTYSDPLPTVADYDNAMEEHLQREREARGYTLREPSDYAGSSVPRWAQDAQDWIAHRDTVMLYGLEIINRYEETGVAPTLEEFRAALPKIKWTLEEEER